MELDRREVACRAVTAEAGRLALDWFERRSSIAVTLKGPQDYASEADAAVERLVAGRLAEAFPDDAFLGEEEGGEVGERVWVVDPIDGTANFIRGVARFCVSVAFVAGGQVQLGAICSPVTGEFHFARRGRGATLNDVAHSCCHDRPPRAGQYRDRLVLSPAVPTYIAAIEKMLDGRS